MKKKIAFVLAAAMLLSLCACGKGANAPAETAVVPAADYEAEYELALTAEFLDLPAGMKRAEAQCRVGKKIWLGGMAESGAVLSFVSLDGGKGRLVELPEGCDYIYAMCAYGDNIAVLAGSESEMLEDERGEFFESAELLELLMFDGSEFVSAVELAERYDTTFYAMLELDGSFYLLGYDALVRLDGNGAELARYECADEDAYMLTTCAFDGEIVVLAWDYNSFGTKFFRLDAQALEPTGEAEIAEQMLYGMGVVNGALAVDTGSGVYALDGDFQPGEAVFEWAELFVSGEYQVIDALDDGYLFFEPGKKICLARWKEAKVRKTVVMASDASYGEVQTLASDFNRSQDEYYVQVNFYDDDEILRLQTEIGAGSWPDLFAFSFDGTLAEMRDELTLENLYDWLDADAELSRDDLMAPVLDAMEQEGALYWVPWKYWVETLIAYESLVPEPGVSVEDTLRIARENELVPIQQWITREMLLGRYSAAANRQFVDWESGTCSFDSEEFVHILQLCGGGLASDDVNQGEAYTGPNDPYLLTRFFVMSPIVLAGISSSRNGDYCFAGYPEAAGNGNLFYPLLRLAITKGAQEKEGAWEFVRFVLSEDEQSVDIAGGNPGLSMNTAVFEREIDAILEDGTTAFGDKRPFTDNDARKLRDLVYGTELVIGADPTLEKIISDCAAAYFSGEKSAEDTARDIQGRASIYVSERG